MASASLAPFRSRNFRLMWSGALLSNIGTWMETVGPQLLRRPHHGKGVVVGDRRRRRVPAERRARSDRFGDGGPMEPAATAGRRQRAVGRRRGDPGRVGRRRNRDAARHRRAQLRRRLHRRVHVSRRSSRPCPIWSSASTSSPASACRTRSGTSAGSSDRRLPRSRSRSVASARRCGATRSASSR